MEMVVGGERNSAKSTHKIPAWRGDEHKVPSLVENLLAIGSYWAWESQFPGMASDRETTIQELSIHPVAYGQHKLDTGFYCEGAELVPWGSRGQPGQSREKRTNMVKTC